MLNSNCSQSACSPKHRTGIYSPVLGQYSTSCFVQSSKWLYSAPITTIIKLISTNGSSRKYLSCQKTTASCVPHHLPRCSLALRLQPLQVAVELRAPEEISQKGWVPNTKHQVNSICLYMEKITLTYNIYITDCPA